jgi:hypothetical protein
LASLAERPLRGFTNFFIRTKHWQLLLLIFVVYGLTELIALRSMFSSRGESLGMIRSFVSMGLGAICFALWVWPMGTFLNSVVAPKLHLNFVFRVAVIFPSVYLALDAFFCNLKQPPLCRNTHPLTA